MAMLRPVRKGWNEAMGTVIGAFERREMAARAVDILLSGGVRADRVSVLGRTGKAADITPRTSRRAAP